MGNITTINSSLHERGNFINTKELCMTTRMTTSMTLDSLVSIFGTIINFFPN